MPVTVEVLRTRLLAAYPDAAVEVTDISGGCGASYEVIIVSAAFQGMRTIQRHREVNARLKAEIAELHAFSQKTYTPTEHEALKK